MTQRFHDDHLLWDAASVLIQVNCPDLVPPILRKAMEGSFSAIDQPLDFLNDLEIKIPTEDQILSLKAFDSAIGQAVKNGNFEEAGDRYAQYLVALQDILEESEWRKLKKRLFGYLLKTSYEAKSSSGQVKENAAPYTSAERTAYTSSEAAEIINVSDQTIRRMCEKGKFPDAYKTDGGHWRVPAKYFRLTPEQARKRQENMQPLIEKAKKGGEIDEFDLI
ncbi:MAG TPA: helix-turn-helix domain-containing protein [Bacillales bacterium]|nr:helix-turn-helix domain-containing protein [Bacillales bacterium]